MSGPSARYALTEDDRAPVDRVAREPELQLGAPSVPSRQAVETERVSLAPTTAPQAEPLSSPSSPHVTTDKWLGLHLSKDSIEHDAVALTGLLVNLDVAFDEKRRHAAIEAANRIARLADHIAKTLSEGK